MVCISADIPQALASWLSPVQLGNHVIAILYHHGLDKQK